jgi:ribonuclease BN (tRNA processing enzyme)
MRLIMYPSDKGDCVLITGKDGKRILADGGMQSSFSESVAPELAKLAKGKRNKKLDVVYVSHIDADHIAGILQLIDDAVAWTVHDHKIKRGDPHKAPKVPRPPTIGEMWHNGFRDLLKDNSGPIEDQLAANALVLSGFAGDGELASAVDDHQNLATSVKQAVTLSQRIRAGVLGIPLNRPAKGKLMMVRPSKASIKVGGMSVRVIAPFEDDLENLREEWNAWLRASKTVLSGIRAKGRELEHQLMSTEASRFLAPLVSEANDVAASLADAIALARKKKLGDRKEVTPPNLASLMLHVSEGKKSLLLTGDGHADDVLRGLEHYGLLKNGGIHVNVLKVQHHGSEHNMTDDFAMKVTADHYVFCGNGFSENPEIDVIQRLFDSRLGDSGKRSVNPEASRPFAFWFNCSARTPQKSRAQRAHMRAVEKLVAGMVRKSKKRMTAHFLAPAATALTIDA